MDHSEVRHYEDQVAERAHASGFDLDIGAFALALNVVRAANLLVADLDQQVYRDRGVSYAGFRILFTLWVVGPSEPKRLASLASVTRSSTSSVLNTLERDGFVARRRESADRRVVTTALTPRGEELVLEAFEEHQKLLGRWAAPLSDTQRTTMNDLLHQLMSADN